MTTISNREIINAMIKNNGRYKSDPKVYAIWEYQPVYKGSSPAWKLVYDNEQLIRFLATGIFNVTRPVFPMAYIELTGSENVRHNKNFGKMIAELRLLKESGSLEIPWHRILVEGLHEPEE